MWRIPLTDDVVNSLGSATSSPFASGSLLVFLVRNSSSLRYVASWLRVVDPAEYLLNSSATADPSSEWTWMLPGCSGFHWSIRTPSCFTLQDS